MKVEDIVMVVDHLQELSINVVMQEDVEGTPHTYQMNWIGYAEEVPLSIMRTDVKIISIDEHENTVLRDRFVITSVM